MTTRTRFAPSPTGFLHIGSLRTAIYAYVIAKHDNGKFILRIEDTDQKREVVGAREKIYEVLKTFGLNWDEGPLVGGPHEPYIQSERAASSIYRDAAQKLLDEGHAFYCFCTLKTKEEIKEQRTFESKELRDPCRNLTPAEVQEKISMGMKPAVRLRVPDGETITFTDFIIKKETRWNSKDVDDAMLLKSNGVPTYHLAVAVDDTEMEVSHIVRSMEWFSSTPIHVLVFKYLGYDLPQIGHPTAILDPEGGKLSKRKGNVSVEDFLSHGYLPEALFNFIILLGWAPKDNRELYTLSEFVEAFDQSGFQKSNPVFNTTKLNWFNQHYIKSLPDSDLASRLENFTSRTPVEISKVLPLVKERMVTLADFDDLTSYFFDEPKIEIEKFEKVKTVAKSVLTNAKTTLENNWDGKVLEEKAREFCAGNNIKVGDYFMVLRLAVTGQAMTPPLWDVLEIIGKEESSRRLNNVSNIF